MKSDKTNKQGLPTNENEFYEKGIEFEFNSLLEEYKAIRQELQSHLSNQDQVINYAIAFIAVLVTFGQYVTGTFINLSSIVSLGASIVFASLSLMFVRYDVNIAICSGYITYILKPRIEELIFHTQRQKAKVLLWENENIKFRLSSGHVVAQYVHTMGRQGILVVPSIGMLIFYVLDRNFSLPVPLWENLLLAASIITNVCVVIALIHAVSLYAKGSPMFKAPN